MNTNFFRGRLLPLLLVLVIFLVWKLRQDYQKGKWISLVGETMGTTYNIKYNHDKGSNYQVSIDSLLKVFNQSLSTYIPDSEISQFNRDSIFYFESPFFFVAFCATSTWNRSPPQAPGRQPKQKATIRTLHHQKNNATTDFTHLPNVDFSTSIPCTCLKLLELTGKYLIFPVFWKHH